MFSQCGKTDKQIDRSCGFSRLKYLFKDILILLHVNKVDYLYNKLLLKYTDTLKQEIIMNNASMRSSILLL